MNKFNLKDHVKFRYNPNFLLHEDEKLVGYIGGIFVEHREIFYNIFNLVNETKYSSIHESNITGLLDE